MGSVLQAKIREDLRKSAIKKIRKAGNLPGVIYGSNVKGLPIYVEYTDFIKVIREAGRNGVITLDIDGDQKRSVMLYDTQSDFLKDEYLHIDFYEVDMSSEVDADVPINLVGEAEGVRDGGVMQQLLREVKVRALPGDMLDSIDINIEKLSVGDSLQVADIIKEGGKVEILNEPEETIVSILAPTRQEEPEEDDTADDGGDNNEDEAQEQENKEE